MEDKEGENAKDQLLLPDDIQPHAMALGELVITFGMLELQLSIMLASMLDLEFTTKGDVLGGLEIREKLRLLKTLGYVVGKDKKTDWYQRLSTLLNTIETGLCAERNRMIHDVWGRSKTPGELIRLNLKPKISKDSLECKLEHLSVPVGKIKDLSRRVVLAARESAGITIEMKPSIGKSP